MSLRSVVLRELHQSYPDQDPEFQKRIALRMTMAGIPTNSFHKDIQRDSKTNTNEFRRNQEQMLQFTVNNNNGDCRSGGGSNQPTETSSSVPSAVTTGKIHQNTTEENNPSEKGFSKLVLDVGGRRWKNRRPLGRTDFIENSFTSNNERQSYSVVTGNKSKKGGSFLYTDPPKKIGSYPSSSSRGGHHSISQQLIQQQKSTKGMSDIASSILSEQHHQLNHQPQIQIDISAMKSYQLEQLRMEQHYQQQHQMQLFAMQRLQQQQRRYSQQRRFNRFGTR